ncbi:RNA-directed DNA polymerase from mobile element jockey [Elysia marginata]|uniref:RNA-directed DNA polymerase from mobile element jockey n=1 Tax=Elysia marginata TaxID=1093978 RepID=A0AAV4JSG3_9GAST|nr:RNA-directed DNA polymerase from mobile element jockey [Elysia marginata]
MAPRTKVILVRATVVYTRLVAISLLLVPPDLHRPGGRRDQKQGSKRSISYNINICGITKKKTELAKILHEHKVHVALLQETLHSTTDLHITGYTSYACGCTSCRGIVTYVRNDLTADITNPTVNSPTDVQKCILWLNGKKWTIYNVYNPPANTCRIDDLQENIYHNTILAADFNGHTLLWGYQDTNNTGKYLEEVCTTTNLPIQQNENSPPKLLHRAHNTLSRPDLTIMSPDLENDSEIRVLPDMVSDHRPTLITIRQNGIPHRQQRSRWNFKKANWEGFRATSEREFRNNSWEDDIDGLEETFTSTILKSSNLHIPKGSD